MLRRHNELTELNLRSGVFKDKESMVAFHYHKDTQHHCVYLAGEDVKICRQRLVREAEGKCEDCGVFVGNFGEMDHVEGGFGPQRCWCDENLRYRCHECHAKKTGREVQLGSILFSKGEMNET